MTPALLTSILTGGAGAVALGAGMLAVRAYANVRLLLEAAATPLDDAHEGLLELHGTLEAADTLRAPLTGRSCAYVRVVVEQYRRYRWETVAETRAAAPSRLRDASGEVDLALADADVVISRPDRIRTGVYAVPSAELEAALAALGPTASPAIGPFVRWREEIFSANDPVVAIGRLERGDAPARTLVPPEGARVLVSDRQSADVLRGQRRLGARWGSLAIVAGCIAVWGGLRLYAGG